MLGHDKRSNDSQSKDTCINYANMLILYRGNSHDHRKGKYKRDIQRPGFLGVENKPDLRSWIFWWKIV